MKCLILIPDYTGSCLQQEGIGLVELETLGIPQQLVNEINEWHEKYKQIIPLSDHDRLLRSSEIEKLDFQGLALADKLKKMALSQLKNEIESEKRFPKSWNQN